MLFEKFHLLTSNFRLACEARIGNNVDADCVTGFCRVKDVNRLGILSIITNT